MVVRQQGYGTQDLNGKDRIGHDRSMSGPKVQKHEIYIPWHMQVRTACRAGTGDSRVLSRFAAHQNAAARRMAPLADGLSVLWDNIRGR